MYACYACIICMHATQACYASMLCKHAMQACYACIHESGDSPSRTNSTRYVTTSGSCSGSGSGSGSGSKRLVKEAALSTPQSSGLGFAVRGIGIRAQGIRRWGQSATLQGSGFGFRLRLQGFGFDARGSGFALKGSALTGLGFRVGNVRVQGWV